MMEEMELGEQDVLTFHIVLVGDKGVGKSSLVERWFHDRFDPLPSLPHTIIWERTFTREGRDLVVQFADTPGYASPDNCPPSVFRRADAVLIVYDVTNRQSFLNVMQWYSVITRCIQRNVVIFLVGTKADLDYRTVDFEEVQQLALSHAMLTFETSSLSGYGIQETLSSVLVTLQRVAANRRNVGFNLNDGRRLRMPFYFRIGWPCCGCRREESRSDNAYVLRAVPIHLPQELPFSDENPAQGTSTTTASSDSQASGPTVSTPAAESQVSGGSGYARADFLPPVLEVIPETDAEDSSSLPSSQVQSTTNIASSSATLASSQIIATQKAQSPK